VDTRGRHTPQPDLTHGHRQMSMPKTSVSEHGGRHSSRPAGGPDAAEAARPGLLELDAQPSAGRIRLSEGAAGKVSASMRRACIPDTCAASGPNREPGRTLIPGDGAAGDQGLRIGCLPGNGGYATPAACPASMTSWRYGLRRTCRLVTGRSHRPRSVRERGQMRHRLRTYLPVRGGMVMARDRTAGRPA
jgi:hypothetical protein